MPLVVTVEPNLNHKWVVLVQILPAQQEVLDPCNHQLDHRIVIQHKSMDYLEYQQVAPKMLVGMYKPLPVLRNMPTQRIKIVPIVLTWKTPIVISTRLAVIHHVASLPSLMVMEESRSLSTVQRLCQYC